jgi:hypothetical protein
MLQTSESYKSPDEYLSICISPLLNHIPHEAQTEIYKTDFKMTEKNVINIRLNSVHNFYLNI